jgi:hypothetical protein
VAQPSFTSSRARLIITSNADIVVILTDGKRKTTGLVEIYAMRRTPMKKLWVMVFGLTALICLTAWSQGTTQQKSNTKSAASSAKLTSIVGTVSADGKTFVNDEDNKSWSVANPEALKGHEGHHVRISAQVDPDKNEVNVKSVKMMAKAKTGSAPAKDKY